MSPARAASPDRTHASVSWRTAVYALPLAAIMAVLYAVILKELAVEWWTTPALSQGLLVPPFAAYVAWLRRRSLFSIPCETDYRGLMLVCAACLLFVTGRLGADYFLLRISFVVSLAGFVWTFWGSRRLRELAFPMLLLATMVPLPVLVYASLAAPLQLFASDAAARIADLAGVSVFRDGNLIHLAAITLGVEEACSGLTSLSSLLVAGVLFGFLLCERPFTRLLALAAAVPVALFANVIRVAGTAILSDWSPAFAMGFYHAFSGWLVFVVGALTLYGTVLVFRKVLEQ